MLIFLSTQHSSPVPSRCAPAKQRRCTSAGSVLAFGAGSGCGHIEAVREKLRSPTRQPMTPIPTMAIGRTGLFNSMLSSLCLPSQIPWPDSIR